MTPEELERSVEAGHLVRASARDLLHGCLRVEDDGEGWARPCRLSEEQERAVGSCQAWHPGLYRQMAQATSGVTLECTTDASEVVLELRVDVEPSGTRAVLADVARWRASSGIDVGASDDGLALEVDGRLQELPLPPSGERILSLDLDDPQTRPREGCPQLPVIAGEHEVRLWLPALRGCSVRRVWANGGHLRPVAPRPCLLVLGDSLAQGFVVGSPALSWPALVARRLGLDLVNQGLGGQVFQPGMLAGLARVVSPRAVVVALGANYRYESCRARPVAADVRGFLAGVARLWPETPAWVVTPVWHDEEASPSHPNSCWREVPSMIAANVAAHDEMRLVDGETLLDADPTLFADGYEHCNAAGAAQVADRLCEAMLPTEPPADAPVASDAPADPPVRRQGRRSSEK